MPRMPKICMKCWNIPMPMVFIWSDFPPRACYIEQSNCNTSNTKECVWSHFQTPKVENTTCGRIFWRKLRRLKMWWNTVSSVWCVFLIETRKRRNETINIYALRSSSGHDASCLKLLMHEKEQYYNTSHRKMKQCMKYSNK